MDRLRKYFSITLLLLVFACESPMNCDVNELEVAVQKKTITVNISTESNATIEQFNWYFSDGFSKATTATTVEHTVTENGLYSVEVEAEMVNGELCYYQSGFKVNDTSGTNTFCDVDIYNVELEGKKLHVEAVATPVSANEKYTWRTGDGNTLSSVNNELSYTYNNYGIHRVTVIYENEWCVDSASTYVEVKAPNPCGVSFAASPTVNNKTVSVSVLPSNVSGTVKYLWDMGDGKQAFQTNNPQHVYSYSDSGTYTIKVKMEGGSCITTAQQTVYVQ